MSRALDAFADLEKGPGKTLRVYLAGETPFEHVVKAVLHLLEEPFEDWQKWECDVYDAAFQSWESRHREEYEWRSRDD